MALGALSMPLLIAGAVITILWAVAVARIWLRPMAGVLRALGGISAPTAAAQGWITATEAERLVDVTEGLCTALGLPVPATLIIGGSIPNALALGHGPEDATLIVTAGTVRSLDRIELEAVLAHELSHVKALDILTAGLAASGLGALGDLLSGGRFGAWLLGPDREIRADLAGVSTTRYPPGLITALERIAAGDRAASSGPTPAEEPEPAVPDGRIRRRLEMGWLAPPPTAPGRPARRPQAELDVRLDVLREL
jgi:Zn-dependent protease with chaperone function